MQVVVGLIEAFVDGTSGGQKRPLTSEQLNMIKQNREAALAARTK